LSFSSMHIFLSQAFSAPNSFVLAIIDGIHAAFLSSE
jgi:hypothetical protein